MKKVPFRDLVGKVFGRLTVISRGENKGKNTAWNCRCECGNTTSVNACYLMDGQIISCGCYNADLHAAGGGALRHGATRGGQTKEYTVWVGMIQRCTNPNNKRFLDYGGRGITVCERWRDFANFLEDMGKRPEGKYSIDRINNDLGYYPDNCCWATCSEQALNRRPKRFTQTETHCRKQKHPFTPENTGINKTGTRYCKTCRKEGILRRRNPGVYHAPRYGIRKH